jgi:hypothetical protein
LTTPRSSKRPFSNSADAIAAEIKVSQRWALRQHSCQPLYSDICQAPVSILSDPIVAEIEVRQRCALPQHSCKTLCPA